MSASVRVKEEEERLKLAHIYSETNHDARFESMRKNTRSARVLRRHEDLRKQCEKEVRTYERWQKLAAAELRQRQSMYLERLRKFQKSLSQPGFHRSDVIIANLAPSPREISSSNSVPHYVRQRGAETPSNNDTELPNIDNPETKRSYSSVDTRSVPNGRVPELTTPRATPDRTSHPLRISLPNGLDDQDGPPTPSSSRGTPRNSGKQGFASGQDTMYPSPRSVRSTTSLPNLTPRSRARLGTTNVTNKSNEHTEVIDLRNNRDKDQRQLLFTVRKENGQEMYIRSKKKTVSFIV